MYNCIYIYFTTFYFWDTQKYIYGHRLCLITCDLCIKLVLWERRYYFSFRKTCTQAWLEVNTAFFLINKIKKLEPTTENIKIMEQTSTSIEIAIKLRTIMRILYLANKITTWFASQKKYGIRILRSKTDL